jgi:predicted DNA-binding protein with PD1-like motif
MQSKEENGIIIARLFSDEDLFESLRTICQKYKVETCVVLSDIGQIKQFTLGYFNGKNYEMSDYSQVHELLSISGMISWSEEEKDYKFHLHAEVGNAAKQAFGGHLWKGIVQSANEVVLLKASLKVKRKQDPGIGLVGLYLE